MMNFSFAIHGEAGTIHREVDGRPYYNAISDIIYKIYAFVKMNNLNITAIDIVEYGVKLLEDDELFNAGKGSVLTSIETHELEASIMDGCDLKCGAVCLISSVKNPVSLARAVMERTPHILMAGEPAEKLAQEICLDRVSPSYYTTEKRLEQLRVTRSSNVVLADHDAEKLTAAESHQPNDMGTVGCVASFNGHVAVATSTGGLTNKLPGRIGDTPIIGAGSYACDSTCAVSGTGLGETFIRLSVAHDISSRIAYGGKTMQQAVHAAVFEYMPINTGGVIAVNTAGEYTMLFNGGGMFRGACDMHGNCEMGIWEEIHKFQIPG